MAFIDLNPERNDSDQQLLRKILKAINLWQGGIIPGSQSSQVNVDLSGGANQVTVVPTPGGDESSPVRGDQVGGYTYLAYYRPLVSLTAYADGDVMGTARLFAAWRQGVGSGILQSVTATAKETSFTAADMDILFLRSNPTGATLTDNAPPAFTDGTFLSVQGRVSIPADSWTQYGTDYALAHLSNLGIAMRSSNAGNASGFDYLMYAVVIARGAMTFTNQDSLNFWFGMLQD